MSNSLGRVSTSLLAAALVHTWALAPQSLAQGHERWTVTHDVSQTGADDVAWSMLVDDANGRVYAAGWYQSGSQPDVYTGFVTALDLTGTHLWTAAIPNTGTLSRWLYRVAAHPQGGLIAVGEQGHLGGFDSDVLVTRIDAQGNVLWTTTWDGSAQSQDSGTDVVVDPSGVAYVVGLSTFSFADMAGAFLRYDGNGNLLSAQSVTNPPVMALAAEIELAPSGDLVISTGEHLVRLAPNGALGFSVATPGAIARSLCVGPDNSAYIGTRTAGGPVSFPFELSRFDVAGVLQWTSFVADAVHPVGGVEGIVLTPNGEVVAAGFRHSDLSQIGPFVIDACVAAFDTSGAGLQADYHHFEYQGRDR